MYEALSDSENIVRATPDKLFKFLNNHFGPFTLDAAADANNTKCEKYISEEMDGLDWPWAPNNVFINPPYKKLRFWMQKISQEVQLGARVTAVLPGWMDRPWFHEHVLHKAQIIYFVQGRIRFGNFDTVAPFPTVIAIYNDKLTRVKNRIRTLNYNDESGIFCLHVARKKSTRSILCG
jgi:phage N-6-adenine-methyltransferase